MNYIKVLIIVFFSSIVILGCNEEISEEEHFLENIRDISIPLIDNYLSLWTKLDTIYLKCEIENIQCNKSTLEEIIKLKDIHDSLVSKSLTQLNLIKNDKYGYKDEIIFFVNPPPYSSPFKDWDIFLNNLCYCSNQKKIVKNINTNILDTIDLEQLGGVKELEDGRTIYINTHWEGINVKNFINNLNRPIEKLLKADEWYIQANRNKLSDKILKESFIN